ncbi:MAG: hypothetical protein JXR76_26380 [Deltaproteobacteria bacterium]|nr:hypothetical protein [Deltaproteobacteria bacterium]
MFKQNNADSGGAIAANNHLKVLSSILVGNHASEFSGAILSDKGFGGASFLLARHDATPEGAIYLSDDVNVEIWNTTISDIWAPLWIWVRLSCSEATIPGEGQWGLGAEGTREKYFT